jgi:hypothetical protein
MGEEANPRKLQRRSPAYGARFSPTALSAPGRQHSAQSIAAEKLKFRVTHTKQTPVTPLNRYFLSPKVAIDRIVSAACKAPSSAPFFPAIAARA